MQQKRIHSISLSFPHSHTPFYLQEFHSLGTEVQIQLTGNGYLLSFQLFTRYFPMKFSSRWHDHRANKSEGRTCALVRHLPSARQRTISFNAWAFGGLYFYFHLIGEKFAADFRAGYHQRGNANPHHQASSVVHCISYCRFSKNRMKILHMSELPLRWVRKEQGNGIFPVTSSPKCSFSTLDTTACQCREHKRIIPSWLKATGSPGLQPPDGLFVPMWAGAFSQVYLKTWRRSAEW